MECYCSIVTFYLFKFNNFDVFIALSFENISQSKVGAIRTKNIKNNGTQIILKTAAGGASIIARVLDSLEGSFGILGTIAGDDTVLIVPMDIKKIDGVTKGIADLFRIPLY